MSSTTPALTHLVKTFEGFHRQVVSRDTIEAVPYLCPAGYWTLGYGRLVPEDHRPISEPTASDWLDHDLLKFSAAVMRLIDVPLTLGQFDALTSWTYNLGPGRLRTSTLRRVLNDGEYGEVPEQMRRWVFGGGVKLPGLIARREAEIGLWFS